MIPIGAKKLYKISFRLAKDLFFITQKSPLSILEIYFILFVFLQQHLFQIMFLFPLHNHIPFYIIQNNSLFPLTQITYRVYCTYGACQRACCDENISQSILIVAYGNVIVNIINFSLSIPCLNEKPRLATRFSGGSGWIRTTEVTDNRFTVCPLWPLGNAPIKIP